MEILTRRFLLRDLVRDYRLAWSWPRAESMEETGTPGRRCDMAVPSRVRDTNGGGGRA